MPTSLLKKPLIVTDRTITIYHNGTLPKYLLDGYFQSTLIIQTRNGHEATVWNGLNRTAVDDGDWDVRFEWPAIVSWSN